MCPGAADEVAKRHAILHRLVKHMDKEAPAFIEPPFTVDYARPTFATREVFCAAHCDLGLPFARSLSYAVVSVLQLQAK